jgi:chloramphenicol 3-O phosphotransferase
MAAIARAGIGVILDEVFLDGGESQARLHESIRDLLVVWIGIRCDPDVAQARELVRGDRNPGMALDQSVRVHQGVHYDFVVDTTTRSPEECADDIVEYVTTHFS